MVSTSKIFKLAMCALVATSSLVLVGCKKKEKANKEQVTTSRSVLGVADIGALTGESLGELALNEDEK